MYGFSSSLDNTTTLTLQKKKNQGIPLKTGEIKTFQSKV